MAAPNGSSADGSDASSAQLSRNGAGGTQTWREEPLPALQHGNYYGNRISGRLHTPAIVNLFGEGFFNYSFTVPRETLLMKSRKESSIAM
jgi:hypothetical protein